VPPDLPLGRYDPPSRLSRALTRLLAAVVALGLVAGGYALYARRQASHMDAQLTSYDVRSDSLVRITIEVVTRGREGECKVRARGRDGNEAGSEIFRVTPTGARAQVVSIDVTTTSRPVNGELVGCKRYRPGSP